LRRVIAVLVIVLIMFALEGAGSARQAAQKLHHETFFVKNDPMATIRKLHEFIDSRHIDTEPQNIKYIETKEGLVVVLYW